MHKDNFQREVIVYALLHGTNYTTFLKSNVFCDLGVKGIEIQFNFLTISGQEEISIEKINHLVVKLTDKRVEFELPKTCSVSIYHSGEIKFPITEIANEWHYLNKIADKIYPYQNDVNIGPLIDCNSLRAIKPREVIVGKGTNNWTNYSTTRISGR